MRGQALNATAASLLGFVHDGPRAGWGSIDDPPLTAVGFGLGYERAVLARCDEVPQLLGVESQS